MGNSERSTFQKSILDVLKETGTYVPIVLALVAQLFRPIEPYSVTTITLAFLIGSLLLVGRRLPQITRRAGGSSENSIFVVGESRKDINLRSRLIDPLRKRSFHSYEYSLIRRRVEIAVILSLVLFSVAYSFQNYWRIHSELLGLQDCFGSNKKDAVFVIIADFVQSDSLPEIEIVENLHDFLISNLETDLYKVCRSSNPIGLRVDALELADKTNADIIIWGSRRTVYKVHIELPYWDRVSREVSYLPVEETADFNFIELETKHLGYLTEFALSEILFEAGDVVEAQQKIEEAISSAESENMSATNPRDLAEGYFLQGLFFDPGTELSNGSNPNPDLQKSIAAYSRSVELHRQQYAALLNVGILHTVNAQQAEAMEDYARLIEDPESPFKVEAYINRSALQPSREAAELDLAAAIQLAPAEGYFFRAIARKDWGDFDGAISDFENAIAADPKFSIPYHELGQLQLEQGLLTDAEKTYGDLCPLLDDELRELVITDLNDLAGSHSNLEIVVSAIAENLRRCP